MGQLEKYGLYVLCLLIFLILGVTLMGSGTVEANPDGQRDRQSVQDLNASREGGGALPVNDRDTTRSNGAPANGSPANGAPVNGSPANRSPANGGARAPNFRELLTPSARPSNGGASSSVATPNPRPNTTPSNGGNNPPSNGRTVTPDPAPVHTPAPADRPTYTIRRGDNYESIARELFGTRALVGEIARLNPRIDPLKLQPNKTILVPTKAEAEAFIAQRAAKRTGVQLGGTYKIKKGDTLIDIAKQQLGSEGRLADLQALNPGLNPTNLRIGQKIRLPRK